MKNPKGGLTAAGRAHFRRTEGAHLKPGVQGRADTPEKLRRKGSFLRRHFAHPRGPMLDAKGQPTRLALSAHAWGEPVPRTLAAARKLAQKGHQLLERYARTKSKGKGAAGGKRRAASAAAGKRRAASPGRKTTARKAPARKRSTARR
nr:MULTISPECIES: DUF6321 domain-containing protein [Myxococcaceae]